jgi:subtilisin-like proprotein convertase family protein
LITVANQPGTITDVNVTLNVTHTFPDDLDILLVGPSGQRVVLMSDAGDQFDISGVALTFDDAAGSTLPDTTQISAGTYQPTNFEVGDVWPSPAPAVVGLSTALSDLNGDSANGTWRLYAADDAFGDGGAVNSWSLRINTDSSPTPATSYPSSVTVAGANNGITDVNVLLKGYNHGSPDDVDALLVGPGGQRVMLMSDVGGVTDAVGLNLTLDDQAATVLPDGGPLVAGTFQPTNIGTGDTMPAPVAASPGTASTSLSLFNGTNPNGTWQLFVSDDAGNTFGGSFSAGWALQISTADTPAAPAITAPASGTRDRDGAFTLAGNAPSGTTVKVFDGGVQKASATASALGLWSVALSGFTNGSHLLTAKATDGFGNASAASTGVTVIVDSIKPLVASTAPAKGAKHASTTANVRAKMNEAVRPGTVTKAHAFIVVAGTTTHLKAKVTWKSGKRTIVINPKTDLAHGTKYKVTVTTAVLDLAGNPLDQNRSKAGLQKKTWKFTTG